MKTIDDFLKEKIFINEQDYAYFILKDNNIYINYKNLKIKYDMIYNPLYYNELLIGAKQLVKYCLKKIEMLNAYQKGFSLNKRSPQFYLNFNNLQKDCLIDNEGIER